MARTETPNDFKNIPQNWSYLVLIILTVCLVINTASYPARMRKSSPNVVDTGFNTRFSFELVIECCRKRILITDSNHAIQWLRVDQAVE